MQVERHDKDHIIIDVDIETAEKLYHAINERTDDITSSAIDFASLLEEACYEAKNDFHQPPHAFDENHPLHPKAED